MLDRIDLQVRMPRVPPEELLAPGTPEPSSIVRERIHAARETAQARNGGLPNARLTGGRVTDLCRPSLGARRLLGEIGRSQALSARTVLRLLRVARTIADLEGLPEVEEGHVSAAISLREDVLPRAMAA